MCIRDRSIVILKPLKLNCLGKFFFIISMYFFDPLSNLLTLPNISGFDNFLDILVSISFSIFFSILSDNFNPSGPNSYKPLSSYGL